ncbi:MAG: DUF2752 domain-containing protein [Nitrospirota bacterium]
MHVVFKKRVQGSIEFSLVYGSITLLLLCAARFPELHALLPSCVFQDMSGIPCPTCGTSRALISFAQGDIIHAFVHNPMVLIVVSGVLLWFLYSLITLIVSLPRICFEFSPNEKRRIRAGAVVFFMLNWMYLVSFSFFEPLLKSSFQYIP